MNNVRTFFHKISYLQYLFIPVSLYYYALYAISLAKAAPDWEELNTALVFYGISLGFSTLQDTTTTQNTLARKVWESPRKGKLMLIFLSLMIVGFMITGLLGFLSSQDNTYKEMSFGLVVLSISLLGLLKAAIEMFENHRKDKNP